MIIMSKLRRFYEESNLHYITCSTYRRIRAFDSPGWRTYALLACVRCGALPWDGPGGAYIMFFVMCAIWSGGAHMRCWHVCGVEIPPLAGRARNAAWRGALKCQQ